MSDILDKAKAQQRDSAKACPVTIRLDLLEGLIAEIERLQADCAELIRINNGRPPSIRSIREKLGEP